MNAAQSCWLDCADALSDTRRRNMAVHLHAGMTPLLALLTLTAGISAVFLASGVVRATLIAVSAVLAVATFWRHRHDQWRREWSRRPSPGMRDAE